MPTAVHLPGPYWKNIHGKEVKRGKVLVPDQIRGTLSYLVSGVQSSTEVTVTVGGSNIETGPHLAQVFPAQVRICSK